MVAAYVKLLGGATHMNHPVGEENSTDGRVSVSRLNGRDDGVDKLLERLVDIHQTPRRDEVDLFMPPVFHRGGRWTRR